MNEEMQLFLEDSADQLQILENALLGIQESGQNKERIDEIFRAMHTIKGMAGMFGFDTVVELTHVAENLMDRVRSGKMKLEDVHIELLLKSKDHLERIVQKSVTQERLNEEEMRTHAQLIEGLEEALHGKRVEKSPQGWWHISLRLKEDFFSVGMDLVAMLQYLEELGELVFRLPVLDFVPSIESIDAKKCYLAYEIGLRSDKSADEIRQMFGFVEDAIELYIFNPQDKKAFVSFLKSTSMPEESVKTMREWDVYEEAYLDEVVETVLEELLAEQGIEEVHEERKEVEQAEPIAKQDSEPEIEKEVPVKKRTLSYSLRVDSSKVDRLMKQVSEMVIANAKIAQIAEQFESAELEESVSVLSSMLEEIRDGIMNIRMVQVGGTFNKFRRIVSDIAKKLGKEVEFVIEGAETELDKSVVEKLSDPLVHMLRNSIDHGIEEPWEREEAGKPPKGRVVLRAYPDAGTIVIEIEDDGRGIDQQKVLQKAIERGVVSPHANLSEREINMLIFSPGLSTAQEVSDISGRGVGMDVVKRNIEELRGTIEVESTEGKGTKIVIRLPLTLAIIDGFLVQVGNSKYIIPLDMVQECLEYTKKMRQKMRYNDYIELRDEYIPLLDMRKHFNEPQERKGRENVVIVRYANRSIGLLVDELYGEFQTVIKPLGPVLRNVPGISGGTILGSGEIALIFDIPSLIEYKIDKRKALAV